MNIIGKLMCMSFLFKYIRKQVTQTKKHLPKVKLNKLVNISFRGFHKFQAGLGRKKRNENFSI